MTPEEEKRYVLLASILDLGRPASVAVSVAQQRDAPDRQQPASPPVAGR
jgi:hypothetical protein